MIRSLLKKIIIGSASLFLVITTEGKAQQLYDFEGGSLQGWYGVNINQGGPWSVYKGTSDWAATGDYALKANLWLYDNGTFYLSSNNYIDFTGKSRFKATVHRSPWGNWVSVTAKIYIKTGNGWTWFDGGQVSLPTSGSYELSFDLAGKPDLNMVREFGVEFQTQGGGNSGSASIYVDNVRFDDLPPPPPPGSIIGSTTGKLLIDSDQNIFVYTNNFIKTVNQSDLSDKVPPQQFNTTFNPNYIPTPLILNNTLYTQDKNGIYLLNKNCTIFRQNNSVAGLLYSKSPSGNLIVYDSISTSTKHITVLNPNTLVKKYGSLLFPPGEIFSILYADNNVLIVRTTKMGLGIIVYDINTGMQRWGGNESVVGAFLAADESGLYTRNASTSMNLKKYNYYSMTPVWTVPKYVSQILTKYGKLYLNEQDVSSPGHKWVHRLNPDNGSVIWSSQTSSTDFSFNISDILSTGALIGVSTVPGPATVSRVYKVDWSANQIAWNVNGLLRINNGNLIVIYSDFLFPPPWYVRVYDNNGAIKTNYTLGDTFVNLLSSDNQSVYVYGHSYSLPNVFGTIYAVNIGTTSSPASTTRWTLTYDQTPSGTLSIPFTTSTNVYTTLSNPVSVSKSIQK
jgi:hypothetical protein